MNNLELAIVTGIYTDWVMTKEIKINDLSFEYESYRSECKEWIYHPDSGFIMHVHGLLDEGLILE